MWMSLRGILLSESDPDWVKRLHRGTQLLLLDFAFAILGAILIQFFAPASAIGSIEMVLLMTICGIWLLGILCLTAREPRVALIEDPVTLRKVVRLCALAALALPPMSFISVPSFPKDLLGVALIGVVGVSYFGTLIFFRRLAVRIPDTRLAETTTSIMWGCVVLLVPMVIALGLALATRSSRASAGAFYFASAIIFLEAVVCFFIVISALACLVRYGRAFKHAAAQARRSAIATQTPVQ